MKTRQVGTPWQFVIAAALCCCGPAAAPAQSDGADELGLQGSDGILWIYNYSLSAESGLYQLDFVFRTKELDRFVAPLLLHHLRGKVHCAAMVADDLYVFYDEGTLRRYTLTRGDRGETAHQLTGHTEMPLPDNETPLAVAGRDNAENLYAIVRTSVSRKLWQEEWARKLEEAQAPENANASAAIETPSYEETHAETGFAIVRYDLRRWIVDTSVPPWLDGSESCYLAVDQSGSFHVLFAGGEDSTYRHARCIDGEWSAPQAITDDPGASILSFFVNEDLPTAVLLEPEANQVSVLAWNRDSEVWSTAAPLVGASGEIPKPSRPLAAAPFAGALAIVVVDDEQRVWCGRWPAAGGEALEPLAEVAALKEQPTPMITLRGQGFIASAILALFLGFVFLRRQDSITGKLDLPPHCRPAGLWRRSAGFVMDASPAALLTLWWWWPPLVEYFDAYRSIEFARSDSPALSAPVLIGWLSWAGTHCIYCTISELLLRTTPGKMAVHCRVANEQGLHCTTSQVLTRNAMRIVELFPLFQMWPTLILMLFLRNRQRLGDLVARTIVIERVTLEQQRTENSSVDQPDDRSDSPG